MGRCVDLDCLERVGEAQEGHSFRDWPVQLGAWPSHNQNISVRGGRRCCLVGTEADQEMDAGFVRAVTMLG